MSKEKSKYIQRYTSGRGYGFVGNKEISTKKAEKAGVVPYGEVAYRVNLKNPIPIGHPELGNDPPNATRSLRSLIDLDKLK